MKRLLTLTFVLAMTMTAMAKPADLSETQWKAFGKNLDVALQQDILGLKISAMRHFIHHADKLTPSSESVFEIMKLYRDHQDENVRRMAVVTLGKIGNRATIGYLERAQHFESSPTVKRTIRDVLIEHNTAG